MSPPRPVLFSGTLLDRVWELCLQVGAWCSWRGSEEWLPSERAACKMDRVDEKCLFHVSYFSLPISFYGVKSWRSRKESWSATLKKNLTLLCVSVLSLHEKLSQERIKQNKSIIFDPKKHCAFDKANRDLETKCMSFGIMLILHSSQAIDWKHINGLHYTQFVLCPC